MPTRTRLPFGLGKRDKSKSKANYGSAPKPGHKKRVKGQCPLQGAGTASLLGFGATPQLFLVRPVPRKSPTKAQATKRPCQ